MIHQCIILILSTLLTGLLPIISCAKTPQTAPTIAIIIDDLGLRYHNDLWATQLPGSITCSILPHRPYSQYIQQSALYHHKEIMVHLPMQAIHPHWLGAGSLTRNMNHQQFIHTLLNDLHNLPYAHGVNNHMGSLLTRDQQAMQWLMKTLQQVGLYFVDSRTIDHSVAEKTAHLYHIPTLHRNVFLDDICSYRAIDRQFKQLIRIAQHEGTAVAIAHPHRATLQYLQHTLPKLHEQGIHLVPVSQLLALRS